MKVNSFEEYIAVRNEILDNGIEDDTYTEAAANELYELDRDNREFFSEHVANLKENTFDLFRQGFMEVSVLESVNAEIDSYATPILDPVLFNQCEKDAMMERVEIMKSALYNECAAGNITLDERENKIIALNTLANECNSVEELESAIGITTEGAVDSVKEKIGKAMPHSVTVKFNKKVYNLKCKPFNGVDMKVIKESLTGIEFKTSKAAKTVAAVIRQHNTAVKEGSRLEALLNQPDEEIMADCKPKGMYTNGTTIKVVCTNPAIAKTRDKSETLVLIFDTKGNFKTAKFTGPESVTESVREYISEIL